MVHLRSEHGVLQRGRSLQKPSIFARLHPRRYHHSLLPEPEGGSAHYSAHAAGVRVNLTFRSKSTSAAAAAAAPRAAVPPPPPPLSGTGVFVGLASGVHHTPFAPGSAVGFKQRLFHPFESPFVGDTAATAALRYRTWLTAQPLFSAWVLSELRGKALEWGTEKKKVAFGRAHAACLLSLLSK